jgi:hypothetical protein
VRDLRKPIDEHIAKTEQMLAGAKTPSYKPDSLDAWKLRDRAEKMSFGQRAMRMVGEHRDVAFREAILAFAPWVSGFDVNNPNDLELLETAKQEQFHDLNGSLLDTVAARKTTESEALMPVNVVRGDIQEISGLQSRDFEALVKIVESGIDKE